MELTGKVAVLYSGARGIGKSYCEALLKHGCKVYFGDILVTEGNETAKDFQKIYPESTIVFRKCDVLIEPEVEDLLKAASNDTGNVDIVVANTGIIEERDWHRCLEINLGSVIRVFSVAMKYMSAKNGGSGGDFIATASGLGLIPFWQAPVYVATKHGIVGFIRSWGAAENYRLTKIRCNCICPSYVETKLLTAVKPDQYLLEEHSSSVIPEIIRLKENDLLIQPWEVADALISLLKDKDAHGKCVILQKGERKYAEFGEEMK